MHQLSTLAEDSIGALEALADAVGAKKNGEVVQQPSRPPLPTGALTPDTLAAAEWLTQPWHAKELVGHLRTPSGTLPRYFQVVIKVAFKQGIPVTSSYLFHHVAGNQNN